MELFEPQDKEKRDFEIEPLEERIAPSAFGFGGEETAYGFQGSSNGQILFIGYDPVP